MQVISQRIALGVTTVKGCQENGHYGIAASQALFQQVFEAFVDSLPQAFG